MTARPEGRTRVEIRVIPRARHNEVGGERDGRLVVRTTAAPVDDAANKVVRQLLARHFDVPTRNVEIIRGHHTRDKTIEIQPRP